MKSVLLVILLLSTYMLISTAQGSYSNCCLGHVPNMKQRAQNRVQCFKVQKSDGDCNIDAVIFSMLKKDKKKGTICTNPNDQWVQGLMSVLKTKGQLENIRREDGTCP